MSTTRTREVWDETRQLLVMLFEASPDLGVVVDSIAADGDRVWVRVTMPGTQHGPFMGRLRAARPLRPRP
ncbi:MAG TPA: ester cyclase [Actinomycetes bacterium]|nr:ester cyclase [Actinomycetes bacterium]